MRLVALACTGLSLLSGCCGGYSVVQTRLESQADARTGAVTTHVLHYSRVGEPPNACGSNTKYVEDLFIHVPSVRPGETFALGTAGVNATYTRSSNGPAETSDRVSGTISVVEQTSDGLVAQLEITIVLGSGDVVELDDSYTFHSGR